MLGGLDASIIVINVRKVNVTVLKSHLFGSVMTRFDGSNPTGVLWIDFQHQFFKLFYWSVKAGGISMTSEWWVLEETINVLVILSTRAWPALLVVPPATNFLDTSDGDVTVTNINEDEQSPNQRQRIVNDRASYKLRQQLHNGQIVPKQISYFNQGEMFRVVTMAFYWCTAIKVCKRQLSKGSKSYSQSTKMKLGGKMFSWEEMQKFTTSRPRFFSYNKEQHFCAMLTSWHSPTRWTNGGGTAAVKKLAGFYLAYY